MDKLNQLRENVWTRWRRAFDRIGEIHQTSQVAASVVYSRVPLFDLIEYRAAKLLPGGRMLKELPQGANFYYTYSLDAKGRPTHIASRHVVNEFDWQGRYLFTDDELEYLEVCLQTAVVNKYTRIALREGFPATLQHIGINGGGSHFGSRTGKEALEYLVGNPGNCLVHVEDYAVADGRTVSGRALMDGWGLGERRSILDYSYSDAGRLEKIVRMFEDGHKATDYAARTNQVCESWLAASPKELPIR